MEKKPLKIERSDSEQRFFKITVAYVGTNYQGWQKQARADGANTIQEKIEKAAKKIFPKGKISLHGSGRTDSGVHARAQVAHMRATVDLPTSVLLKALNAHLPDDIRILSVEDCDPSFHAQLSVKTKTYRYFILSCNSKNPVHWPFLRPYTWFVTYPLDFKAMEKALKSLEGVHDFKSFQNRGTPVHHTTREILEAKLVVHEGKNENLPWMPGKDFQGKLLEVRICGTGFLKQMVRTIVGTIVEVGRGKISLEDLEKILDKKDRRASGLTAPPQGLFLDNVEY